MPEGDTIFRAARTLHAALAGRTVTGFESVHPALTRVADDSPVVGRTVEHVTARGKHLLVTFSGSLVLRTHMRMSGSWHLYRPAERWQRPRGDMRIVIRTDTFVAVAFNVPVAEFVHARDLERGRVLGELGPDLLSPGFSAADALERIRAAGAMEIGDVVLDQRTMAGAGNVYKSEVLFLCRVNPFTPASALPDSTLSAIVATLRKLMLANVAPGSGAGIVTYVGMRRTTGRIDPAARLWVYGRKGKPCRRCATPVTSRKQGPHARTTYWCPACQAGP